jgi:hypothetical protein
VQLVVSEMSSSMGHRPAWTLVLSAPSRPCTNSCDSDRFKAFASGPDSATGCVKDGSSSTVVSGWTLVLSADPTTSFTWIDVADIRDSKDAWMGTVEEAILSPKNDGGSSTDEGVIFAIVLLLLVTGAVPATSDANENGVDDPNVGMVDPDPKMTADGGMVATTGSLVALKGSPPPNILGCPKTGELSCNNDDVVVAVGVRNVMLSSDTVAFMIGDVRWDGDVNFVVVVVVAANSDDGAKLLNKVWIADVDVVVGPATTGVPNNIDGRLVYSSSSGSSIISGGSSEISVSVSRGTSFSKDADDRNGVTVIEPTVIVLTGSKIGCGGGGGRIVGTWIG